MTSSASLGWGILGPGTIAKAFRDGLADSESGKLVAIGTRNAGRAGLAGDFPGARIHEGYDALLGDPEVEAIYIATPHPFHAEWAIKCAEAGKHVLCEKPMGLTAFEADAMFHAAGLAGTFMGEAFMYRVHPQTRKLCDLVAGGAIGEVRKITSSFGFAMPKFDPAHRLYANDLAGGGILDVGGYPASMARLIAGVVQDKPFADPVSVSGMARLGESGVDEWASALLQFSSGILAEISCSVSLDQENVLRITGTRGRIEVKDFWFAGGKQGGTGLINVITSEGTETIEVTEQRNLYAFEADAAAAAIRAGRQEFEAPGMSWADTLGNLRVLDKWRADAGLVYDIEKPAKKTLTIKGETLMAGNGPIGKREIRGISKPSSVVAIGFEDFRSFSSVAFLLDAFFERGGNLFDTGFVYGGGMTETLFGQWHASRGVREESLLIAKGAHSPLCYPDVIGAQLTTSLDRLQTDYADVYFMHRDNTQVPVGEFVDAVDAQVMMGRIRGPWGGSNWSRERLDAAIEYAKVNGKTPPQALSNNFSLAKMIKPIWNGSISASDDSWQSWLSTHQLTNFAWSSQGRGFFTDRAGREKRDSKELVETWYSEENFGRRDRAVQLATELGISPLHIALAYVLNHPLPIVPLIGPRRIQELDDSLRALDIRLTPEQVRWLEGGQQAAA
jgi:predicted dehydrogenase/aryl-alcohol dehydrogenase-like predicted oxidoreductase